MVSVLASIGLIVLSSVATIIFTALSIGLVLEVATTIIALLVSTVCIHQIHQEHYLRDQIENNLKKTLFAKIQILAPGLYPSALRLYLNHLLENDDPEKRIKRLAAFQQNSEALHCFIRHFKQYESTQKALKHLGLSW